MSDAISSYHVSVAAEAFAAGLFAQAGCDVSVQYGANQPDYDLVVGRDKKLMKVSVKGSQDGAWGLVQNYKSQGVSYHEVAELWFNDQARDVIFCLVQFKDVSIGQCPRTYLAKAREIADRLKQTKNGSGYTKLYENYTYKKGIGFGTSDKVPDAWRFSTGRVNELLNLAA